jgi:predicted nucleotidyltransferase
MAVAERWKGYKELPDDISDKLNGLKDFWDKEKNVLLVYLFGSLAEKKKANDIDLAILFNKKPSYKNISELSEKLYKHMGTQRVDIVDLMRASPVFKFNIITSGKLLFKRQIDTANDFELRVIKEHMDTKYLRKVQRWFLEEKVLKSA